MRIDDGLPSPRHSRGGNGGGGPALPDPELEQWFRDAAVTPVKSGRHRTVYRIDRADGEFYLKVNWHPGVRGRLLAGVRTSKSRREAVRARAVRRLGISTIDAIAVGALGGRAFPRGSYLVSRALRGVVPLDEFLHGDFVSLAQPRRSRLRHRLAREIAATAARLHSARMVHDDFHPGNFLLRHDVGEFGELALIDLADVRQHRLPLSGMRVLDNLSQLETSLHWVLTRTDRLRFFRAYWNAVQGARTAGSAVTARFFKTTYRAAVRRADAHRRHVMRAAAPRFDRTWVRGNRRVLIADTAELRCRGLAELGRAPLETWRDRLCLGELPEHALLTMAVGDEAISAYCVGVADEPAGIGESWGRRFARWRFRGRPDGFSGTRRAWEMGHACLRRGIFTPVPLGFVEPASGQGGGGVLLAQPSPDAVSFSEFIEETLPALSSRERRVWLTRHCSLLGRRLAEMHDWKFDHRGITADSLLVTPEPDRPRLWFCAIHEVQLLGKLTWRRRVDALARMYAAFRGPAVMTRAERLRVLKSYLRHADVAGRKDWKAVWREVSARQERTSGTSGDD